MQAFAQIILYDVIDSIARASDTELQSIVNPGSNDYVYIPLTWASVVTAIVELGKRHKN